MNHFINRALLFILLTITAFHQGHSEVTFFGIPIEGMEERALTPKTSSACDHLKPAPTAPSAPSSPAPLATKPGRGPRIFIMVDVSMSVVNKAAQTRFPMNKIRDEALNLIKALPDGASVGLVQFTRNYKSYAKDLVELTPQNREAIENWMSREWVENGKISPAASVVSNGLGIVGVLGAAAQVKPDTIFVISDGSFQWGQGSEDDKVPWKEITTALEAIPSGTKPVVFNFIGFQMKPDDKARMGNIVRRTGGKMTHIEKN